MQDDDQVLELICYDCVYIMVCVVQEIWFDVKVIIGLICDQGWFYDFDCEELFIYDDLVQIEVKMKDIINVCDVVCIEVWSCVDVQKYYEEQNEFYKIELLVCILEGEDICMYWYGDW